MLMIESLFRPTSALAIWHLLVTELPSSFWFVVVVFVPFLEENQFRGRPAISAGEMSTWRGRQQGGRDPTTCVHVMCVPVCYSLSLRPWVTLVSSCNQICHRHQTHVTSLQLPWAQPPASAAGCAAHMVLSVLWVLSHKGLLPLAARRGSAVCMGLVKMRLLFTLPSVAIRAWLKVFHLWNTRCSTAGFFLEKKSDL